jgi:hypothetical protein
MGTLKLLGSRCAVFSGFLYSTLSLEIDCSFEDAALKINLFCVIFVLSALSCFLEKAQAYVCDLSLDFFCIDCKRGARAVLEDMA